jgi:GT2 family glycosyltransferase
MLEEQYRRMQTGESEPTACNFYTGNASVRCRVALAVGDFNEQFKRSEDVEFAIRLAAQGVRSYFEPRALAYHEPARTFASWKNIPYQ